MTVESGRGRHTMRILAPNLFFILTLAASAPGTASAEEFKYYVWVDDEGIVHAEEEAPKGRDYQVRIIEDINANVVPTEDFRPYSDDLPEQVGEPASGPAQSGADDQSMGSEGQQ